MTETEGKCVEIERVGVVTKEKLAEVMKEFDKDKQYEDGRRMIFISNDSGKQVHLSDYHFWHGIESHNYTTLESGSVYYFTLSTSEPEGIKFGYVYSDGDDSLSRQFVAAVFLPLPLIPATNAKVYVESGPISRPPVDWNVVGVKLDMATSSSATYDDPIFKGRVTAEVTEFNGQIDITFETN